MSIDTEALGRMLEAIDSMGGATESLPQPSGVPSDGRMEAAEELLRRGWIEAAASMRGDDRLFAIRNIRITPAGQQALVELRRATAHVPAPEVTVTALEEKRRKRLHFMMRLYEETDGSRLVFADMWKLGSDLGWDKSDTERTVEYLNGEGLLEYATMGGGLSITHLGVVEVEQALTVPDEPTQHFPPAVNVINVQYMLGSQIQQGSPNADQYGEFTTAGAKPEIADIVRQLREALPELEFPDDDDRGEFEQELATIENQLASPRPKSGTLRTSLSTLATLITKASATAGGAVQLVELAEKLHRLLPLV